MSRVDVNQIDILAKNAQLEWIEFFGVRTDSVVIVFDDQNDRQLAFHGKSDRFVKLTLPAGRITDRSNNNVIGPIQLHRPSHTTSRQCVCSGRRGDTPNIPFPIRIMARHLATATGAGSFSKVDACKFRVRNASSQHHRSVTIVGKQVVVVIHQLGNNGHRFMAHTCDLKPAFTLPM